MSDVNNKYGFSFTLVRRRDSYFFNIENLYKNIDPIRLTKIVRIPSKNGLSKDIRTDKSFNEIWQFHTIKDKDLLKLSRDVSEYLIGNAYNALRWNKVYFYITDYHKNCYILKCHYLVENSRNIGKLVPYEEKSYGPTTKSITIK